MNVMHIVENMDKGAVENWLLNVFIESRKYRPRWKWTFYCVLGKPGRLDDLVRKAGGTVLYSPVPLSEKLLFLKHLRNNLKQGKYDLVHMHHDFMSGFYLLATIGLHLNRKVVHVHNNDREIPVGSKALRKGLLPVFQRLSFLLADDIVGISNNTLSEYKGSYSRRSPDFSVLYYGIPMEKFGELADPVAFREQMDIPANGKVLLFIGRMNKEKNPVFILEVLSNLLQKREDVYAVFVGKGEQEALVRIKAQELGLSGRIRVMGWCDNTVSFLKSSDVFVFPRRLEPKEGLGLVVVEAQCSGLPIFMTNGIVEDAIILKELAFFNGLEDPKAWANDIHLQLTKGKPITQEAALERMKASRFELSHATMNLINLYDNRPKGKNINISL